MININGETWRVLVVPSDHTELYNSRGEPVWGVCDDFYKIIFLNENLDDFTLKQVLCHELVHACMFSYDVDLTLEQEELVATLIMTYGEEIIEMTNVIFKRLKDRR